MFHMYLTLDVDEVGTGATDELEEEPSASQMAGKSPNFCVLLHGSLKVEGMVALVQLGWESTFNFTALFILRLLCSKMSSHILWVKRLNVVCFFFPAGQSGTACCTPKQTVRRNQIWWCPCLSLVQSLCLGWARSHIWDQSQVTCDRLVGQQQVLFTFTANVSSLWHCLQNLMKASFQEYLKTFVGYFETLAKWLFVPGEQRPHCTCMSTPSSS